MDDTQLTGCSLDGLRALVRDLEAERTSLRVRQLEALAELERRGFADLGVRDVVALVQVELNCTRRYARSLVKDMDRFASRVSLTGEPLEPQFPVVAAALSEAEVTFEHAVVIGDAVTALPSAVRAEHGAAVEARLVEFARLHDPVAVRDLAKRIHAHVDPDGPEPVDEIQHRQRSLELLTNLDGSGIICGTLTAPAMAIWQALIAAFDGCTPDASSQHTDLSNADPSDQNINVLGENGIGQDDNDRGVDEDSNPTTTTDDLGRDTRTLLQRQHDAFEEAGRRLLGAKDLPQHAGLPTQLLITIDLNDLEQRTGRATTHHGGSLTVQQVLHLAAEAEVIPVILDQELGLIQHGRGRRLADPKQRKAIFARDRGCTFPGCTKTAAQSQVHHMRDWLIFGPTDTDNLTLTCGYHNNEAPRMGWKAELKNGFPHWTPPTWHDPEQTPRRNYLHHPELLLRT